MNKLEIPSFVSALPLDTSDHELSEDVLDVLDVLDNILEEIGEPGDDALTSCQIESQQIALKETQDEKLVLEDTIKDMSSQISTLKQQLELSELKKSELTDNMDRLKKQTQTTSKKNEIKELEQNLHRQSKITEEVKSKLIRLSRQCDSLKRKKDETEKVLQQLQINLKQAKGEKVKLTREKQELVRKHAADVRSRDFSFRKDLRKTETETRNLQKTVAGTTQKQLILERKNQELKKRIELMEKSQVRRVDARLKVIVEKSGGFTQQKAIKTMSGFSADTSSKIKDSTIDEVKSFFKERIEEAVIKGSMEVEEKKLRSLEATEEGLITNIDSLDRKLSSMGPDSAHRSSHTDILYRQREVVAERLSSLRLEKYKLIKSIEKSSTTSADINFWSSVAGTGWVAILIQTFLDSLIEREVACKSLRPRKKQQDRKRRRLGYKSLKVKEKAPTRTTIEEDAFLDSSKDFKSVDEVDKILEDDSISSQSPLSKLKKTPEMAPPTPSLLPPEELSASDKSIRLPTFSSQNSFGLLSEKGPKGSAASGRKHINRKEPVSLTITSSSIFTLCSIQMDEETEPTQIVAGGSGELTVWDALTISRSSTPVQTFPFKYEQRLFAVKQVRTLTHPGTFVAGGGPFAAILDSRTGCSKVCSWTFYSKQSSKSRNQSPSYTTNLLSISEQKDSQICVTLEDGSLRIYDIRNVSNGHLSRTTCGADQFCSIFLPNNETSVGFQGLVCGGRDRILRLWHNGWHQADPPHYDHVTSVAALNLTSFEESPINDGFLLLSGSKDRRLRSWMLRMEDDNPKLFEGVVGTKSHEDAVTCVRKTLKPGIFTSSDRAGRIQIWGCKMEENNVPVVTAIGPKFWKSDAAVSEIINYGESFIFSGSVDGSLCLWDFSNSI
eukprot:GHVP01050166.1.p1 GENE.GHVP01050166.1~~GHVP01050166.1.p1  ORF type:complete len:931 (+),score=221.78 GHVP01050166.1:110-2794(+)